MNAYELVLIVKDEKENLKNLQKSVTDLKGKVTAEETWGKKNFYFPIKKQTSGVYLQWKIELGLRQVSDLKKKLDYDENVLRYLLLQAK
jgi:ribosomal protein S6